MKKLLAILLALLCLTTLTAFAESDGYESLVQVTDDETVQELESFARAELAQRYPSLTEEQLARFSEVGIYTYLSREGWWLISLYYDGIESVLMEFEVIRTPEGTLSVEWVLPWDIAKLVQLYDSSISHEDALAVGRISLGAAMAKYEAMYPGSAQKAVERYGLAMLDPSGFMTLAWFVSPLNQGLDDEPPRWCLNFYLPVDPEAEPDDEMNPLWYRVEINAATGAVEDETLFDLFTLGPDQ